MPRGSGRRPKPTKLKQLAGNPGKRKLNDSEPAPPAEPPEMPIGLSKIAQQEWNSIVPQLAELGVLTRIDGKALAAYCHAYSRWRESELDVEKYGLIVEEPVIDAVTRQQLKLRGRLLVKLKKNPAISTSNDALKLMKSFLIEFGLTPASRSRLRIDKKPGEQKDPFEEFMRGSGKSNESKHIN